MVFPEFLILLLALCIENYSDPYLFIKYIWPNILVHNPRNFLILVLRSPHSTDLKGHLKGNC